MRALIALLALAMVASCTVLPPDDTLAYRSGTGMVQAVQRARVALPKSNPVAGTEVAGSSYQLLVESLFRPRWVDGYQLTLKMADDSTQKITQDSAAFQAGDLVEITSDGRVMKSAAVATPPILSAPPTTPAPRDAKPAPEQTPRASSAKSAPEPTRSRAKTASKTYRPGLAVVESASVQTPSPPSASSGGTTGPRTKYRLKMLDGTTQEIEETGDRFKVGDWVRLTREGRLSVPVTHTR